MSSPDDDPDFSDVKAGSSSVSLDPKDQRTYTVVKGDSLSKIARDLLGDARKWRAIYELNKDQIKNPDLIYPGQVLKLPPS